MTSTVDALKALYVAFGGSADDVANLTVIPDVINAIASLGSIKAASAMSVDNNGNLMLAAASNKSVFISGADVQLNSSNGSGVRLNDEGKVVINSVDMLDLKSDSDINIAAESEINISGYTADDVPTCTLSMDSNGVSMAAQDGDISLNADGAFNVTAGSDILIQNDDNSDIELKAMTGSVMLNANTSNGNVELNGDSVLANGNAVATE